MRLAVTTAPGVMEVRNGEDPVAGPGEALLRVEAVGLCGSDFHLFDGTHPYAHFPQTQGHEFVGVVQAFGPGYDGPLQVGERVAVEPVIPDGTCSACRRGRYNCCSDLRVLGAHVPGGLAERVAVRTSSLFGVGDLPPQVAVLTEPMSIGLQCVVRARITADDTVVVVGAGPIGQAAALGASDRGARVLVADRVAGRLELATHLGADRVVDTTREDLASAVRDLTDGEGATVAIEATGVPALLRACVDLVAHAGTVVVVGISTDEVRIPVVEFTRKELDVRGSRNSCGIFGNAVDLVRRYRDRVGRLVTHTAPLEDVPDLIEYAMTHPHEVEKAVVLLGPG